MNRTARAGVALQFSFHPRSGTSLQSIPLLGSVSAQRARAGSASDAGAVAVPPLRIVSPPASHGLSGR